MEPSVARHLLVTDARRQHGLFTLQQALGAGYSRASVRRHLERGDWTEVQTRVYRALPAPRLSWRTALMASTLSTGGVASRRSAGALLGLLPEGRLEVTVERQLRCRSRRAVHSTDTLPATDLTVIDGIRSTNVTRTLLDLGSVLPRPRFEDVLDTAIVRRLVRPELLASRAADLAAPARGGCAVVLGLFSERMEVSGTLVSVWEARVLREFRRHGLPEPVCNHRIEIGGRVRYIDFAWPDMKVAVEFDGFEFHAVRRTVFDDDRERQNDLVDDDWRVFRLTSTALARDPSRAVGRISRAIGATR